MDKGGESYRRYCGGADDALGEIIIEYRDGLIFYLNSFVKDIVTAEGLAEDVFFKLAVKKPKFREKSSFKTWLYAIGRNEALTYLKKQKNAEIPVCEFPEAASEYGNPEAEYIKDERKAALHRNISALKAEYRQVLWLYYFEEMSAEEISVIMKKSVHNIETLLYRARGALKEKLEKEGCTYENV